MNKAVSNIKKRITIAEENNTIEETYSKYDYDRSIIQMEPITRSVKIEMMAELDELKTNMLVHPDSARNTVFYNKFNPAFL